MLPPLVRFTFSRMKLISIILAKKKKCIIFFSFQSNRRRGVRTVAQLHVHRPTGGDPRQHIQRSVGNALAAHARRSGAVPSRSAEAARTAAALTDGSADSRGNDTPTCPESSRRSASVLVATGPLPVRPRRTVAPAQSAHSSESLDPPESRNSSGAGHIRGTVQVRMNKTNPITRRYFLLKNLKKKKY